MDMAFKSVRWMKVDEDGKDYGLVLADDDLRGIVGARLREATGRAIEAGETSGQILIDAQRYRWYTVPCPEAA